jgi:hypothetical protein
MDRPVTGDFDKDDKFDIAIYRKGTGTWLIVPSSGRGVTAVGWGGPGFTPVLGDYDGDGKTDIAVYRGSNGGWLIIPSSGAAAYGVSVGWQNTDKPVR